MAKTYTDKQFFEAMLQIGARKPRNPGLCVDCGAQLSTDEAQAYGGRCGGCAEAEETQK